MIYRLVIALAFGMGVAAHAQMPDPPRLDPSKPMTLVEGALVCLKLESLKAVVPMAELHLVNPRAPVAMPRDCVTTGHVVTVKGLQSVQGFGKAWYWQVDIPDPKGRAWVVSYDLSN